MKQIENFYQARKTHRTIRTVVLGSQVALYGGVSVVQDVSENRQRQRVAVPLNLTFVVRSRAYILGKLVKSKFYERIRCSVTLRGSNLGKHSNLTNSCVYEWMRYLCLWSVIFGESRCGLIVPLYHFNCLSYLVLYQPANSIYKSFESGLSPSRFSFHLQCKISVVVKIDYGREQVFVAFH